jgi:GntR family transcriptional regulator, rspAB operon transcriptional repressor
MSSTHSVVKRPRRKPSHEGSLAERAYQLVLDQILRGTLPLGAVVSRRRIAEQFGMSFIPVTAALQRLERDGLLESRPRAGTRVKIPTPTEVQGRFEMREALECQSARLCAERSTFQERLDLKRSAEQMDILFARAASDGADQELIFAKDRYHTELHTKIAAYARSEALRAAIENAHVLVFNWLYNTAAGQTALPEGFHQQLIEAIVSGDPDVAEAAMRAHVRIGVANVMRAVAPETSTRWRERR